MHHLSKVRMINKLNEEEIKNNVDIKASWHQQVSIEVLNIVV
jgi:hypothetical protein